MGIIIKNNYPKDPNSPVLVVEMGNSKNHVDVYPQEQTTVGRGDFTLHLITQPKRDEDGNAIKQVKWVSPEEQRDLDNKAAKKAGK